MSKISEDSSEQEDDGCLAENENEKRKKLVKQPKWICKREPAWRMYMKKCLDDSRRRAKAQREQYGDFYCDQQKEQDHSRIPKEKVPVEPHCRMLNVFNQKALRCVDGKRPSSKIWDDIRVSREYNDCPPARNPFEWPSTAPCLNRDIVKERKVMARKLKMKVIGATPCQIESITSPESSEDEKLEELACKKELVHARIPITYLTDYSSVTNEKACGERIALVDGDCNVYKLPVGKVNRSYANLCLRGLDGMHLEELQRIREHTWKFCLFQNIVALLVKTQLRYKFAWSANIDYIYDQALTIFLHTGYLNIKPNHRFDDILVYNYTYSVELQLVHEIKDFPIIRNVKFDYFEESMKDQETIQRTKVTLPKCVFGEDKVRDDVKMNVHTRTARLEKWFDKLDDHYTNCILRTTRFSLAFWQDGSFWFIYNPYRCDKYGLWDDEGSASITKFCTKDAMKRHIMILLVRAYAYKLDKVDMCWREYNYMTIQIYQIVYHSCKIHNVKLYLRSSKKPKPQLVEKIKSDPCLFDPYEHLVTKPCEEVIKKEKEEKVQELDDKIENPHWIKEKKISWSRVSLPKSESKKPKWHEFEILEPRRLFVLWCDTHTSDKIFVEENRNKQARACYVVCAGMRQMAVPEYWTNDVIKAILVYGDAFYLKRQLRSLKAKGQNVYRGCADDDKDWQEYPEDTFQMSGVYFKARVLSPVRGRLFLKSDLCLWRTLQLFFQRHSFGILTCESCRLGIFKQYHAYYVLDVCSIGPPVFESGDGKAYLLRAACLKDFVTSLVLIIGSVECSPFSIRPVEVDEGVDTRKPECEDSEPEEKQHEDCGYGAIRPKPCGDKRNKKASKRGNQVQPGSEDTEKPKTMCLPAKKSFDFPTL